jgi:hypothetical protein
LEKPKISGKMPLKMLATPIRRVEVNRDWQVKPRQTVDRHVHKSTRPVRVFTFASTRTVVSSVWIR